MYPSAEISGKRVLVYTHGNIRFFLLGKRPCDDFMPKRKFEWPCGLQERVPAY